MDIGELARSPIREGAKVDDIRKCSKVYLLAQMLPERIQLERPGPEDGVLDLQQPSGFLLPVGRSTVLQLGARRREVCVDEREKRRFVDLLDFLASELVVEILFHFG